MADQEHLKVISGGAEAIPRWRRAHYEEWLQSSEGKEYEELKLIRDSGSLTHDQAKRGAELRALEVEVQSVRFDLRGADLQGAQLNDVDLRFSDLAGANLRRALLVNAQLQNVNLAGADLSGAILVKAGLSGANLTDATLRGATLILAGLSETTFVHADLTRADLYSANLTSANFSDATLTGANLSRCQCVDTIFDRAVLTGCNVYGTAVWDISVIDTVQRDLVITKPADSGSPLPVVTVDDLEIAQFIHLLVINPKIRRIIDDVTSKVVLILGRFTEERKAVLDAIRERLRHKNYVPVLFDFDKPDSKDLTGTVETLARLARFIIADLTDPSSIPHELATIVPFLRTTPVLPLRLVGAGGYSMFDDFRAYSWVLNTYEYMDAVSLIAALPEVIAPADAMAATLRKGS